MASRDAYRTGDDEDGDEEVDESFYKTQKDAVLFAIDVSASMLQRPPPSKARKADTDSAVSAALRCAYQIMQQRILAQPKDLMGILLFGTAKSKFRLAEDGDGGDDGDGTTDAAAAGAGSLALSHGPSYPHCYLLMDLGVPAAEDVRALKSLVADDGADGADEEGILTPADADADGGGVSMANVLFCANQIFTTNAANFGSRRLFVITDNDDPHAGDAAARAAAAVRAKDLYDLGVAIELFPIQRADRAFDRTRFYDDIVYRDPTADAAAAEVATAAGAAAASAVAPAARSGDGLTLLASLVSLVSAKQTPKRAYFSNLPFEVAPGLCISIKGYIVLQPQKPARTCYVWLGGERPLLATSETVKYAAAADGSGSSGTDAGLGEAGAGPGPGGEIRKAYKFGGELIHFTPEELGQLKQWPFPAAWQGKGLRIVGFKPRVLLPPWASVKRSTYVYPSEEDYVGSTRVFSALWQTLRRTAKVAIAWYVPRSNSNPQLVAIVPSSGGARETKGGDNGDDADAQDGGGGGDGPPPLPLPAGLWLYPLPFAEDIRKADDDRLPAPCPPALRDQMRPVVENLFLPKTVYDPSRYPNPALQWHYRILQTLALEEEVPETGDDRTLPKFRAIDKRVGGSLAALKAAFALEAGQLETRRAIKREADDDGGGGGGGGDNSPARRPVAKRPKTGGAGGGVAPTAPLQTPAQLRAAVANGTLERLSVAELKAVLVEKGQSVAGKKAVLVERLEQWVEDNA